jgi:glycosyltransferase involved in cell wall biosynthesis
VELLKIDFEVCIFCSARDLGDSTPMDSIALDQWSDFSPGIRVYYSTTTSLKLVRRILDDTNPDFIYINGVFSVPFNLIPLWVAQRKNSKIVISPRGMLQRGALSIKPLKKKLALFSFKSVGLFKAIRWHVTDGQEKLDVERLMGLKSEIVLASNIPKPLKTIIHQREKKKQTLKLVFLSLISEKKNLHLALEALKEIQTPISFHIYGPVKDEAYWLTCKKLMEGQVHDIQYRGIVNPRDVQETLSNYHAFVLPTKGENFGHAIYEAFSVGTPVLVSPFTPWGRLQDFHAGITVGTLRAEDWRAAMQKFIDFNQNEYSILSEGAYNLARSYLSHNDFRVQYQKLFS